ncbi:MAG: hypothetical protein BWZ09_01664 [Alphaproteobacteria bacterium ADurb.BinA305]|jgi:hypothetical protein|nr:MAG: hypothetical protein BWZ09_01664 [Alphaproteobacteria bacterium ADurb.BinA305]
MWIAALRTRASASVSPSMLRAPMICCSGWWSCSRGSRLAWLRKKSSSTCSTWARLASISFATCSSAARSCAWRASAGAATIAPADRGSPRCRASRRAAICSARAPNPAGGGRRSSAPSRLSSAVATSMPEVSTNCSGSRRSQRAKSSSAAHRMRTPGRPSASAGALIAATASSKRGRATAVPAQKASQCARASPRRAARASSSGAIGVSPTSSPGSGICASSCQHARTARCCSVRTGARAIW